MKNILNRTGKHELDSDSRSGPLIDDRFPISFYIEAYFTPNPTDPLPIPQPSMPVMPLPTQRPTEMIPPQVASNISKLTFLAIFSSSTSTNWNLYNSIWYFNEFPFTNTSSNGFYIYFGHFFCDSNWKASFSRVYH